MSRSPAFALAALVQKYGMDDLDFLKETLSTKVCVTPHPLPNLLIARYADEIFNANGKLLKVAADIASENLTSQHGLIIKKRSLTFI